MLHFVYYIGMIYYLLIAIYFVLTWIRPLYGTKFFDIMSTITRPFMRLVSGKLIVGSLDLGATIGMVVYAFILYIIDNVSYMI